MVYPSEAEENDSQTTLKFDWKPLFCLLLLISAHLSSDRLLQVVTSCGEPQQFIQQVWQIFQRMVDLSKDLAVL